MDAENGHWQELLKKVETLQAENEQLRTANERARRLYARERSTTEAYREKLSELWERIFAIYRHLHSETLPGLHALLEECLAAEKERDIHRKALQTLRNSILYEYEGIDRLNLATYQKDALLFLIDDLTPAPPKKETPSVRAREHFYATAKEKARRMVPSGTPTPP